MYHFIWSSKDTYIYEVNLNDEYNFGADEKLILKKDFCLMGNISTLLRFG